MFLMGIAAAVEDRSAAGIAAAVHREIRAGRVLPGERLPTVRELAKELKVSPATVNEAWQALAAAGVIESRGRAGTTVKRQATATGPTRYRSISGISGSNGLDLASGTPDPNLLPPIAAALSRVIAKGTDLTTSYLDDPVVPELEHLLRVTWPFAADRVDVVDGAMDALSRVVDDVIRLGDRVVIEDPGFPPLIDMLNRAGAQIIGVALDAEGILPSALAKALALQPVAVFIQPRAQNPTGVSMSQARAAQLATLLASSDALVIEDDHSGEIALAADVTLGTHLPERCVHIRSYSKSHGPDLRIAAIGGPALVLDRIRARRTLGPGWTSRLTQSILVELLTDDDAVQRVAQARTQYAQRAAEFSQFLTEKDVPVAVPDGINAWIPVADERIALVSLAGSGINVAPGDPFLVGTDRAPHLRVTCGLLASPADRKRVSEHLALAAAPKRAAQGW